jgi:hypothetical protein
MPIALLIVFLHLAMCHDCTNISTYITCTHLYQLGKYKTNDESFTLHFENAKCSSFTYALVFCFVAAEVAKKGLTHHKVPHKSSKQPCGLSF